jgi:hypothetical protein
MLNYSLLQMMRGFNAYLISFKLMLTLGPTYRIQIHREMYVTSAPDFPYCKCRKDKTNRRVWEPCTARMGSSDMFRIIYAYITR